MRVVLRIILATMAMASSAVTFVACSGGGGGSSAPQGPPPPPFAATLDTGLAIGLTYEFTTLVGDSALVLVSEAETGLDLNGDGDQLDSVAHLLDVSANVAVNLRLAVKGKPIVSDQQFAFLVSEVEQGMDLNGDADGFDAIWYLLNPANEIDIGPAATNPRNTGLATRLSGGPGAGAIGGIVMMVSESAMAADFNGDGDMVDDIAFAVEHFGDSISTLGLPPHAPGTALVTRENHILLCSSEAAAGMDLNGDTDANDTVLALVSFEDTGAPTSQLVGSASPRAVDPGTYRMTDSFVVYLARESDGGMADLNGDGDTADSVLALMDINTGAEFFPTDNTISVFPLAANPGTGIATSGSRVIFGIDEKGQGKDLNIDQDQVDSILAWVDVDSSPAVARSVGLTLGSQPPLIEGTTGLVTINEAASALVTGVDHNADGDISDQVAFRIDLASSPAVLRNLGLAVEGFSLSGPNAILLVSEAAQFGSDRNGDTDTNDIVPAYGDLSVPSPAFRSLGVATFATTVSRFDPVTIRIAAVLPEQPFTAYADLNGDGDSNDSAYYWFDLNTSLAPATVRPPTPYLIGLGSFSRYAPIQVDSDTILFATSETLVGRDLNGDNDQNDTLLRIVRRAPTDE